MNVLSQFLRRTDRRGGVWCAPLKIRFPPIYRLTPAAATAPGAPILRIDYALGAPGPALGEWSIVRRLDASDTTSLIVRHHSCALDASIYLTGVEDLEPRQPLGLRFQDQHGVFTLVRCRTRKSWPGPTILYVADCFHDEPDLDETWELAVCPKNASGPQPSLLDEDDE